MWLFAQEVEERRHGVPHRVPVQRHVHRLADIDLAVAIAGEIGGLQQADGDARREQLSIPRAVVHVRDLSRIFPIQNFAEAFLHGLKGLPVAPRRHGVSLFAIALIGFRIPSAAADAFDKSGRDAVALDRQRMIGVCDVGVVDALEVCIDIEGRARRFWEAFDDRLSHFLPEQPQPVYVRRGFADSDD